MERTNNKKLNSHDLARELEISKLQEENEELKFQLRNTTHCFDEEEHNKLKEEITNLSKDVDMWNTKYNVIFDKNKRLKEALEAKSYCKYANKCDELYDCSREEYEDMANANTRLKVENYDLEEENQKLKKQLKNCYCNRTDCSARIKDSKVYDSLLQKVETQQKEFIKYLKDKIYSVEPTGTNINYNCDYDSEEDYINAMKEQSGLNTLKEILNKYKEIIGDDK